MCAQTAEISLSEEERLLLLYLGRYGVDYKRMGQPERYPGALTGLREMGLVSALGGSNMTLQLTTGGLEELYRLLDRQGTLEGEELEDVSRHLSPKERLALLRVLRVSGLVESVAAMADQGVIPDVVKDLVTKGLLQYTGYPFGPTHEVYLTETGYQVAKHLAAT